MSSLQTIGKYLGSIIGPGPDSNAKEGIQKTPLPSGKSKQFKKPERYSEHGSTPNFETGKKVTNMESENCKTNKKVQHDSRSTSVRRPPQSTPGSAGSKKEEEEKEEEKEKERTKSGHRVDCPRNKSQSRLSVQKGKRPWGSRDPEDIRCSCVGSEFRQRAMSKTPKEEKATPKPSRRRELWELGEAFISEVNKKMGKLSLAETKALVSRVEKGVRGDEAKKIPVTPPKPPVSKITPENTTRKSKTATPLILVEKEPTPLTPGKKVSRPSTTPLKIKSARSRTPLTSNLPLPPQRLENREKQLIFDVNSKQAPSDSEFRSIIGNLNSAILLTDCEGDTRFVRDPLYSEMTATYDNYALVGLKETRKNEMRLQHNVLQQRYVTRLNDVQGNIALRQSNTKAELISSLPATAKLIYLQHQNQPPPSLEPAPPAITSKPRRSRLL